MCVCMLDEFGHEKHVRNTTVSGKYARGLAEKKIYKLLLQMNFFRKPICSLPIILISFNLVNKKMHIV